MKRTAFVVGIISVSIIAYQIALMRILSISQFHHFAYMIISVALLGFGSSGTFLSLFRTKVLQYENEIIFLSSFICSMSMLFGIYIFNQIDINPFLILWNLSEGLPFLIFYLIIFVPFFFGAVIICLAFMRFTENVNIIYFSNLTGSAFGGIIIIGLFFLFESQEIPELIALLPLLSAVIFSKRKLFIFVLLGINILSLSFSISSKNELKISEYKSISKTLLMPETQIINEIHGPLGKLSVISGTALRYVPGLSLGYRGEIPVFLGMFSDGEWVGTITDSRNGKLDYLNHTTSALPYVLKNNAEVFVIGSGTGSELQLALQNNAKEITGIELNSQVIDLLNENSPLLINEKIKIIIGEGRGVLRRIEKKYDIISIPILEGFTSSAAGMYALHENYLYTAESFESVLNHLSEDGIFSVTTWVNTPPRHSLKLFATIVKALESGGYSEPERHIAAIRSWGTVTIIVKKNGINAEDISTIKKFCEDMSFDTIHFPGINDTETNIYNILENDFYFQAVRNILTAERENYFTNYIFNITPPTDSKPFFSHFLKPLNFSVLKEAIGEGSVSLYEYGYVILIATLLQIFVVAFILIIIPTFFIRNGKIRSSIKLKTFFYFSGLGVGYMFIEIMLIQKFILYLSHPIYSVSVVIVSLLFFSGIGSFYSEKISGRSVTGSKSTIIIIIALAIVLYTVLPLVFNSLIHLDIIWKYLLSIIFLAPIAFFMGIPFPVGIRKLSGGDSPIIPWAWSINGFFSVISAVLAPIIAMEFGFLVVIILAVIAYLTSLQSSVKASY